MGILSNKYDLDLDANQDDILEKMCSLNKYLGLAHGLLEKLTAIGHRVVHGGNYFSDSVLITDETVEKVTECNVLAPLHNPANLLGIEVCSEQLPNLPPKLMLSVSPLPG